MDKRGRKRKRQKSPSPDPPTIKLHSRTNIFIQLESFFGSNYLRQQIVPEQILAVLKNCVSSTSNQMDTLSRIVTDGLVYVKSRKTRIYDVAEVLFIMALLCFQVDKNSEKANFISKIIRLQMEAVSLVTEAGLPWTRQLSISRWFTFLTGTDESNLLLSLYPFDPDLHVKALTYYLSGAKDVVFRLPFRVTHVESAQTSSNPAKDIPVPEGFGLRDVHLTDFPIRRSQDNCTFTPLGLACRAVCVPAVAVLLQQGASPVLFQSGLTETPLGILTEPLTVLFRMLNKSRTWRDWELGGVNPTMLASLQQQETNLEQSLSQCVKLILRTVRNIPVTFYSSSDPKALEKSQGLLIDPSGKRNFYLLDHYKNLIPKESINYIGSLQHICRLRIRHILNESRGLPNSIKSLPITWPLKPYLNLQS